MPHPIYISILKNKESVIHMSIAWIAENNDIEYVGGRTVYKIIRFDKDRYLVIFEKGCFNLNEEEFISFRSCNIDTLINRHNTCIISPK